MYQKCERNLSLGNVFFPPAHYVLLPLSKSHNGSSQLVLALSAFSLSAEFRQIRECREAGRATKGEKERENRPLAATSKTNPSSAILPYFPGREKRGGESIFSLLSFFARLKRIIKLDVSPEEEGKMEVFVPLHYYHLHSLSFFSQMTHHRLFFFVRPPPPRRQKKLLVAAAVEREGGGVEGEPFFSSPLFKRTPSILLRSRDGTRLRIKEVEEREGDGGTFSPFPKIVPPPPPSSVRGRWRWEKEERNKGWEGGRDRSVLVLGKGKKEVSPPPPLSPFLTRGRKFPRSRCGSSAVRSAGLT